MREKNVNGMLYVMATPIGNLKDITLRAMEAMREADVIVAENRERAMKLLNHLGLKKRIISINSQNEERKARMVVEQLRHGADCVLITGAGTPCISDPGTKVVRQCYDAEIDIRVLPGPSAVVGGLSISGMFVDRFFFYGFLPARPGKRKKVLRELVDFPYALVFFESPRRLLETLMLIHEELGNRRGAVLKEMTKVHEEAIRGEMEDIVEQLRDIEMKGEYMIVIEGKGK